MNPLKQLNKFISETGLCSRREADKLIAAGVVTINGITGTLGDRVGEQDIVLVNDQPLYRKKPFVYLAFNKPVGVTSTTDRKDPTNIIDFIGYKERIFPIGRLDKMSEGLILLTNDGDIVNKILRAGNNHEKEYLVTVDKLISEEFLKRMRQGVRILNTTTLPCQVERLGRNRFRIVLTQGINRQIRRMCEALTYRVVKLKRIRIMNIELKGIELGRWRYLTTEEISVINSLLVNSSKTEEASSSPKKNNRTADPAQKRQSRTPARKYRKN